jgi:tRNA threonylcarbamoyladenosine biosynthesis protein TsaE
MTIRTDSLQSTYDFAQIFVERLRPQSNQATILALHGDLGAGKTAFTQGVAKALAVTDVVTSPTFVIEKIYQIAGVTMWKHLIHIDAYRLTSGQELLSLGFDDVLRDPGNLIVLEWPEKVTEILPTKITKLEFKFIDEQIREIKYEEN